MSVRKSLVLFLVAALLLAGGEGFAQSASKKEEKKPAVASTTPEGGEPHYIRPETPEQRQERLGTTEDPGSDPDPETIFYRFGKQYKIWRAEKRHARYLPEVGWVRPLANANFQREIYQENDKYVWVWDEIVDHDAVMKEAVANESTWSKESIAYFEELRPEFAPLDASRANVKVTFADSSAGLPTTGSWRNGAAVADMNEDGFVDLVLPPQRGAAAAPTIFLGDGNGGWKKWAIKWPHNFNYGSVVAADFNKDKHLDLAFSIHLTGVGVFLGDGKGQFREVTAGLEQHYPTRRLIATDVDADGWIDIVVMSEGPVGRGRDLQDKLHGNLRAFLNKQKGQSWQGINLAEPQEFIGGDYVSAGMFNSDRYPDFIGASVYFNSAFTLFLSKEPSTYDPLLEGLTIPGRSYYQATTAARFQRGAKTDDAIVSYLRYWPNNLDALLVPTPPLNEVSGVDRITFTDGKAKRTPIVRWKGALPVRGMANGDFDGDGNLDIAYVVAQSSDLHILLGDGKGGFKEAQVAGIQLPPQRTYDLVVTDLNRDKKPDVLVMFEAQQATAFSQKNGSVRVYLNKGTQGL